MIVLHWWFLKLYIILLCKCTICTKIWENCRIQTLYLCHKDVSHAWWIPVVSRFVRILLLQLPDCSRVPFLVSYGFYENFLLLHELDLKPRNASHGRKLQRQPEPEGRQAVNRGTPLTWIRALKSPPLPESIKSFFNCKTVLLSRITHSGEIGLIRQEICRRTNIAVFNQRLTLAGRELHTEDNIPPNCTIILGFQSRGGTRSHGRFQCLDVLASVLQTPTLNTVYERTLRTYMQVSTNWHLQVHLSLEQS